MKNYVQPGINCTATAPTGGVSSGDAVLIGSLFGVACGDAAEGAEVELATVGVYDLAKSTGNTLSAGSPAYFDTTAKAITGTATGNKLVGVALAAAGTSDTIARIRLNGTAVV